MRRVALALAGAAALAGAVLLDDPPPAAGARGSGDGSALEALGRSLGGWRVLVVDVLFLRGEALRKQGRTEELPAIYESILELDPDNEAAADALAGECADNLLATAPTVETRFAWWREASDLTFRALRAHPDSPRLSFRVADLLLRVPEARPELEASIDRHAGGPAAREAQGVAALLAAARSTEHLPKVGRLHLLRLARAAPLLAMKALLRGDPPEHAARLLAAGEELLRLHPAAVAAIQEEVLLDQPGAEPERVPLARVLRAALDAVAAAIAFERGDAEAPIQDRAVAYQRVAGKTPLAEALRAWLVKR